MHGVHTKSRVVSFSLLSDDFEKALKSLERCPNGYASIGDYARAVFLIYLRKAENLKKSRLSRKANKGMTYTRHCLRCGCDWTSRISARAQRCPHCYSYVWDKTDAELEQEGRKGFYGNQFIDARFRKTEP